MLKTCVVPTLLYRDYGLVKGVGFDSWRHVGNLIQQIKVYDMREVDELIFLDITASREKRNPDFELVDDFADECHMPLTVGGGIRSVEDVRKLLEVGADKVAINTAAVETPKLISDIAEKFGQQCVVVSIDFKQMDDGSYRVVTLSGTKCTDFDPTLFAKRVEAFGAGEILLTSIDRDGTMEGYVIDIIKKISDSVRIPVIASGGAGNYQDMYEAIFKGNASAVAAASIYHFTQQTPKEAKLFLHQKGIPVRQ